MLGDAAGAPAFRAISVVVVLDPVTKGWDGEEVSGDGFGIFIF